MKYLSSMLMLIAMLAVGAGCCTHTKVAAVVPEAVSENESNIKIVKEIENVTVAFVTLADDELVPYCAGVWVDEDHIITANHCAESLGRKASEKGEEEDYDAVGDPIVFVNRFDVEGNEEISPKAGWLGVIEKADKRLDLALVKAVGKTSHHDIAKIIDENVRKGETLHIVGHTIGLPWTYTKGVVAAVRSTEGPHLGNNQILSKVIQASSLVWMGNSGGGAFDSEGHLIGVCSWVTLRAPGIAYFIHLDEIKSFLKR